jgi:hypothetical protein
MVEVRDTGVFPESMMDTHSSAARLTRYEWARGVSPSTYERALGVAMLVGRGGAHRAEFVSALSDPAAVVRFWGATGLVALGRDVAPAAHALVAALDDQAPTVRVAVAHALCAMGREGVALPVLGDLLTNSRAPWVQIQAASALLAIGPRARPLLPRIREAARARQQRYVKSALNSLARTLSTQ